jgi:hypothetical protein
VNRYRQRSLPRVMISSPDSLSRKRAGTATRPLLSTECWNRPRNMSVVSRQSSIVSRQSSVLATKLVFCRGLARNTDTHPVQMLALCSVSRSYPHFSPLFPTFCHFFHTFQHYRGFWRHCKRFHNGGPQPSGYRWSVVSGRWSVVRILTADDRRPRTTPMVAGAAPSARFTLWALRYTLQYSYNDR